MGRIPETIEEIIIEDTPDEPIYEETTEYHIEWKGYPLSEATWEPYNHLPVVLRVAYHNAIMKSESSDTDAEESSSEESSSEESPSEEDNDKANRMEVDNKELNHIENNIEELDNNENPGALIP